MFHSLCIIPYGIPFFNFNTFSGVFLPCLLNQYPKRCWIKENIYICTPKGIHEQIAKKIVEFSSYPVLDLINYFEVLLFCYLTGNADMHLKNFSLYKKGGEWVLAPAYDLLSTYKALIQERASVLD